MVQKEAVQGNREQLGASQNRFEMRPLSAPGSMDCIAPTPQQPCKPLSRTMNDNASPRCLNGSICYPALNQADILTLFGDPQLRGW